jgi:hypothetical protein
VWQLSHSGPNLSRHGSPRTCTLFVVALSAAHLLQSRGPHISGISSSSSSSMSALQTLWCVRPALLLAVTSICRWWCPSYGVGTAAGAVGGVVLGVGSVDPANRFCAILTVSGVSRPPAVTLGGGVHFGQICDWQMWCAPHFSHSTPRGRPSGHSS